MHTRWAEAPNHYESLAVSLRAVLAYLDAERTYDELIAMLGLGALTVAVPGDSLGWWCTYARDAALAETASVYGLQLRALHPPAATYGLGRSVEYAQHFQDSYAPLIMRSVEQGQLVLAWHGWPAPRERLWGVLTEVHDEMLFGYTLLHDGRPLPLTGPAHQVYIVENYYPSESFLSPDDQFRYVQQLCLTLWKQTEKRADSIVFGAQAYESWADILCMSSTPKPGDLSLHRAHSQASRVHVASRAHLATWLRRIGAELSGNHIGLAAHWAAACDQIEEVLRPYESPESVKQTLAHPGGREQACRAIKKVEEIEADVVTRIQSAS